MRHWKKKLSIVWHILTDKYTVSELHNFWILWDGKDTEIRFKDE